MRGWGTPCLPILWLLWRSKNSLGSPTRREHPLLPGKPEALQACVGRCFICQESPLVSAWSVDVRGAICSGAGGVYGSLGRDSLCRASSQLPPRCWHLCPARSLAPVMKADVSVYEDTGAPRAAPKSIPAAGWGELAWWGDSRTATCRGGVCAMQSTGNAGSLSQLCPGAEHRAHRGPWVGRDCSWWQNHCPHRGSWCGDITAEQNILGFPVPLLKLRAAGRHLSLCSCEGVLKRHKGGN